MITENMLTLAHLYRNSTSVYSKHVMSTLFDSPDKTYTYSQFRIACDQMSSILSHHGVGADDKVAIFSAGHPNWAVAFFSAVAFGRVAVPILPDFTGREAAHVLEHSETKVLFASKRHLAKLDDETKERVPMIIDIDTLEILKKPEICEYKETVEPSRESLAAIIYTSGTTGNAKGVMLLHRNFIANIHSSVHFYPLNTKDTLLSILPLAHTYEMTLGMIYPFSCGSKVVYISKAPTPSYLVKVMAEVHPTAMLTVPLIIEKVYKNMIVPTIEKNAVLSWMNVHTHKLLARIISMKLVNTFGGKMRFFGIGGAKLDPSIEAFLNEGRFPYFIGYGLTECAPLLCLSKFFDTEAGQIGGAVYGVTLKLDNVNPETGEGEIVAKGDNIMPGYYKDPERTAAAFNKDGWFKTNDLAAVNEYGRYTIKGRLGNMILGASGENIYPEEIEHVILELPEVEDAIVVSRGNKLVALIKTTDTYFKYNLKADHEKMKAEIEKYRAEVIKYVNARVSQSSRLSAIELMTEPFQKTATLKIRRFKYKDSAPTI